MLLVSASLISRTEGEYYTAISLKTMRVWKCVCVCVCVCVVHQTSAPKQRNIWHTDVLKFQILYFWGPSCTWGISQTSKCYPSFSLKANGEIYWTCHMSQLPHFLNFTHFAPLNKNTLMCKMHEPKHKIQQCCFSSVLTKATHCSGLLVNDDKETHFISD